MSEQITKIRAREVLDSRGNPTVECEIFTQTYRSRFIVPSGASTGQYEAVELRDNDPNRFHGKGVLKAVSNVNDTIAPKLIGMDPTDQKTIDSIMLDLDGTPNKSNLGANAILSVSGAAARLGAKVTGKHLFEYLGNSKRLPTPLLNVINGGKHAGGNLAIQEFMIVPKGFDTFSEGLRASSEVYHSLKKYLKEKYGSSSINVGDEGGFAPQLDYAKDALAALSMAINNAGYEVGEHFFFAIDAAASEFLHDGKYRIDGMELTADELLNYYLSLIDEYPALISLEDPFDENDFESFAKLVKKIGKEKAIVGDDLTVTNVERINTAIQHQAMNYLLLKINQIGTLTEARNAFDLTKSQNWGVVVSHRSGETEDAFIADLAVGWGAERIKTGAPARSERVAKYNQLLRIEHLLGEEAKYYKGM
ncbi:MAG: phosphopyruvate hydratase [Methanobacteriota archaeon]|nr:MAG: phosphopyruvate hydratase [Euryarchaeota archaeon]